MLAALRYAMSYLDTGIKATRSQGENNATYSLVTRSSHYRHPAADAVRRVLSPVLKALGVRLS